MFYYFTVIFESVSGNTVKKTYEYCTREGFTYFDAWKKVVDDTIKELDEEFNTKWIIKSICNERR